MSNKDHYLHTGWEHIAHIDLGRPVERNSKLWRELSRTIRFSDIVAEPGQDEIGLIQRFRRKERTRLRQAARRGEMRSIVGAVAWVRQGGNVRDDRDHAIHLLNADEMTAIRVSSTSLLLAELVESVNDKGTPDPAALANLVAVINRRSDEKKKLTAEKPDPKTTLRADLGRLPRLTAQLARHLICCVNDGVNLIGPDYQAGTLLAALVAIDAEEVLVNAIYTMRMEMLRTATIGVLETSPYPIHNLKQRLKKAAEARRPNTEIGLEMAQGITETLAEEARREDGGKPE